MQNELERVGENSMTDKERDEDTRRLLLKADMELEEMEAFSQQHKQAFRVAFDFLKACFPPTRQDDYWSAVVEKFKDKTQANVYNPLVKHLLLGAYNYIGEIVKDIPLEE